MEEHKPKYAQPAKWLADQEDRIAAGLDIVGPFAVGFAIILTFPIWIVVWLIGWYNEDIQRRRGGDQS